MVAYEKYLMEILLIGCIITLYHLTMNSTYTTFWMWNRFGIFEIILYVLVFLRLIFNIVFNGLIIYTLKYIKQKNIYNSIYQF